MARSVSRLILIALLAVSCGRAEFSLTSTADELVSDVMSQGAAPDVAECVRGMAIQDERLTTLDLSNSSDKVYVDDLQASCERAARLSEPTLETPDEIPFVGPQTYGDDPELDRLWEGCEAGDGPMCDELFETAPVDSDYESFGVTCGNREGVLNCAELWVEPAS